LQLTPSVAATIYFSALFHPRSFLVILWVSVVALALALPALKVSLAY
jgi:hypothetical protein